MLRIVNRYHIIKKLGNSVIDNIISIRSYNKLVHNQIRSPNVGKALGINFERDIQSLLSECGYRSFFYTNDDDIDNVFVNTEKTSSEFDAFIKGGKHSFEYFQDSFKTSFTNFPPSGDVHNAIVEIKLNAKAVKDWVEEKKTGSRYVFFESDPSLTKILVVNGGEESEEFVKSLSSDECKDEYKEAKAAIIYFKINVFYKMWASGEVFSKILQDNEVLKSDNEVLKSDNEVLKSDNEVLRTKCENIENDLMLLKKHLNMK